MDHKPQDTHTIGNVDILWNKPLLTHNKFPHNKSDIVVHDRNFNICKFIEVTIPMDHNIVNATAHKLTKYKDLAIEIQRCWNTKEVTVIPIVMGALGLVLHSFSTNLARISNARTNVIQKTVLLHSANILRHILSKE